MNLSFRVQLALISALSYFAMSSVLNDKKLSKKPSVSRIGSQAVTARRALNFDPDGEETLDYGEEDETKNCEVPPTFMSPQVTNRILSTANAGGLGSLMTGAVGGAPADAMEEDFEDEDDEEGKILSQLLLVI